MNVEIFSAREFAERAVKRIAELPERDLVSIVHTALTYACENRGSKYVKGPQNLIDQEVRGKPQYNPLVKMFGDDIENLTRPYEWACWMLADRGVNIKAAIYMIALIIDNKDIKDPSDNAFAKATIREIVDIMVGVSGVKNVRDFSSLSYKIKFASIQGDQDFAPEIAALNAELVSVDFTRAKIKRLISEMFLEMSKSGLDYNAAFDGDVEAFISVASVLSTDSENWPLMIEFCRCCAVNDFKPAVWILRVISGVVDMNTASIDTSDPAAYAPEVTAQKKPAESVSVDNGAAETIVLAPDFPTDFTSGARRDLMKPFEFLRDPVALQKLEVGADELRAELTLEFPWMTKAINLICREVAMQAAYGVGYFSIRPLLLVGAPGTGKTRFAARVGDLVGISTTVMSLGGVADSMGTVGSAAGWHQSQVSLPVNAISNSRTANPLIVLDEIEKVRASHNGDAHAGLLSMLEPSSASAYHDQSLRLNVDISRVNWIATANDLRGIPMPLLNRFRVIEVEAPTVEHVAAIIRGVRVDFAREMGVDVRFVPHLDEVEMTFIEREFGARPNVRSLIRLVHKLIERRERQIMEVPH